MSAIAAPPTVKFHLSLNVANLDRSAAFFRALFGQEPAKCRPDYAKFELDEPPVVLSLEPHAPGGSGALNHVGFRLADSAELVQWQRRLEMAGISTQREEGVECCYARQTKFWVRDPDSNLWEIYVLEEDLDHRGAGQAIEALPATVERASLLPVRTSSDAATPAQAIWQHQLGTPIPEKIFALDATTHEVHVRGSFNQEHTAESRRQFLGEVQRILAPGGTVHLHILTGQGSRAVPRGALPGPASYVTFVPGLVELLSDLATVGFERIEITKLAAKACFLHDGHELRETMLVAHKPDCCTRDDSCDVIYLGPFAAVRDDAGRDYRRGERVTIPASAARQLPSGSFCQPARR